MSESKIVVREDREWEQVVFAEVLVPDVVNNYGDVYTREAIAEFAYEFARCGYGIDIDHNQVDVNGVACYVVESFIARPGDADFIEGSWVVGLKVTDPVLWAEILAGNVNGFSFEAEVFMTPAVVQATYGRQVTGTTEAHPEDGHSHTYLLVLDEKNNPISGGTSESNGHSHRIVSHTVTETTDGHNHRFQVLTVE
jgi:hypothetical protein